jgi:hypothetical protein
MLMGWCGEVTHRFTWHNNLSFGALGGIFLDLPGYIGMGISLGVCASSQMAAL